MRFPADFPHEQPLGPYVVPGTYSLVLTVNGQQYRQPLRVTLDPRVQASQADLVEQLETEKSISAQMAVSYDGYSQITRASKCRCRAEERRRVGFGQERRGRCVEVLGRSGGSNR